LCDPRFIEEVLINTPMFLYVQETCPVVAIAPTGRCTDNRTTWQPLNGVTSEAQNERQISGAAELVTASPTPGTNEYVDAGFMSCVFNGKPWSRTLRTYTYTITFNEVEEDSENSLFATDRDIALIEGTAQSVTNNDNGEGGVQQVASNTAILNDPAANPFGPFGHDLVRYTKLKNAFGNSGSSFLPQLAFSTSDLAAMALYNQTTSTGLVNFENWDRHRTAPSSTAAFPADEASRVEIKASIASDDPETTRLHLTQFAGAWIQGDDEGVA
jgi:hypothetical protein